MYKDVIMANHFEFNIRVYIEDTDAGGLFTMPTTSVLWSVPVQNGYAPRGLTLLASKGLQLCCPPDSGQICTPYING